MAKLAILGHATRGKEVIGILEMLGGKNIHNSWGVFKNRIYTIDEKTDEIIDVSERHYSNYNLFTLEEFLEKFPYKVGNKVIAYAEGCLASFTIQDMRWNSELNKVEYKICSSWIDASLIMGYCKEESMREKNNDNWAKWDLPDGYEFQDKEGNVINTDIIKLVKKQPQYPKTYVECAKMLDCFGAAHIDGYKGELLEKLQELIVCRDAYWKIAGEQMGLGKPWKYDMSKDEFSYAISYQYGYIQKCEVRYKNHFLSFPTAEMRDFFFENFKDLIEECKEFL